MAKPPRRTTVADHMPFGPGRHGMMGSGARAKDRRGTLRRLAGCLWEHRLGLLGVAGLVALSSAFALAGPYLMGRAIDRYIEAGDLPGLARVVGLMVLLYLLTSATTWAQQVWMIRIAQRTIATLRRDLFGKLQTLSLRFFDRHPHGELMSRLTNDTDTVNAALGDTVTQFISSIISVAGAGYIMFAMNWRLALASLVTFPLVTVTAQWIGRHARQGFRDRQRTLGVLNGMIEETIAGQRVVKVCHRERETIATFAVANEELKGPAIRALIAGGVMGPVMQVFRNLGFAVLAGVGTWLIIRGQATVGIMAAFMTYSDFFNRPLMHLANLYASMQSALAGAERVFAVLDETPEVDAPEAVDLTEVKGEVEFSHVDFGYVPDVPVLKDVSFQAAAGQTIALVGSTGAGKTTIVNLLTRFYDVDSGAIRVDGHDVRALRKDSLRRALGIVLQDTYLFAGTVRENLRYGRLEATDVEIEEAARLANADTFITHLPHGYDTVLTDAGNSLSQGQRQLLAIARAMLADPAILILDEATSSVDTRTEIHVQQAMRRLMAERTSFIIAHRLSTIRQADSILVIDHGEVVERGTHADLLAQHGAYYQLCASQTRHLSPAEQTED